MEIAVIVIIIALVVLWKVIASARKSDALLRLGMGMPGTADCYSLLRNGVAARGILLKVGSQRSAMGSASQGFYEVRAVTIDVEIAGRSPYQCDCSIFVPANLCRLVLPGATVELRVDPDSSRNIAVFGPGVGLPAAAFQ